MKKHQPYSLEAIEKALDKFEAFKRGNNVTTLHDSIEVRNVEVSDQYRFFDFKKFVVNMMKDVEKEIDIESFQIKFVRGVQEIQFLSKDITINGDKFKQSLYLLNSNDRTRALQFTAGFYSVDNGNNLIMPVNGVKSHTRAVHKGQTFEEKTQDMTDFIYRISDLIDKQQDVMEYLYDFDISLKELVSEIVYENRREDTTVSNASLNRASTFLKNMIHSPYDKIKLSELNLSDDTINALRSPSEFIRNSKEDIIVNAYQALKWYSQVYRLDDSSIVRRECNRFMKFVNTILARKEELV